jgi:hypothetical protein
MIPHRQLVLLYFFLAKKSYLSWLHQCVLENSLVELLPHIPPLVDHYSVKYPSLVFINFCAAFSPVIVNGSPHWHLVSTDNPSHCFKTDQTSFVKTQSLQRCVGVSGSIQHSLQVVSFDQLHLIKLLAVRIFLCNNVHAKKLHLGSAFALQIGGILNLLNDPWN